MKLWITSSLTLANRKSRVRSRVKTTVSKNRFENTPAPAGFEGGSASVGEIGNRKPVPHPFAHGVKAAVDVVAFEM
jgi:hypothetical protein